MRKSEFIREAYRRADNAGRIDDQRVIEFYLNMFLDMGMLPPRTSTKEDFTEFGSYEVDGYIDYYCKWEPEDE